jgi:hypothetical protein
MKKKLFTYVFCTFVFSQVFNYFNCRKIGQKEVNVFERIFTKVNGYFWISIAFVVCFQFFMVQYLFFVTRTEPLSRSEWGACIVAGSMVISIAALLKLVGHGLLKLIPFTKFIDEDKEVTFRLTHGIRLLLSLEGISFDLYLNITEVGNLGDHSIGDFLVLINKLGEWNQLEKTMSN